MTEGQMYAGSIHINGTDIHISGGLNLLNDGDKDSIASRLATILKEAVDEWKANPTGNIQFHDAMIDNTYHCPADRLFPQSS